MQHMKKGLNVGKLMAAYAKIADTQIFELQHTHSHIPFEFV